MLQDVPKAILVTGTGGAIAWRFAREGCIAWVMRRTVGKPEPPGQRIRADGG